jgi:bifunctional enzyme CysN/CysC
VKKNQSDKKAKMTHEKTRQRVNVVFVGHVDHGKSTVLGRLLVDTNSLPKGKLEQVQERCKRSGKPFEYAYLIDALKDEQSQNITIDSARIFFRSQKRDYIIIDAPGHIEFLKNMVTGASHADTAIMVIDAQAGVEENTRRHGYLLWMLGIRKIIVVINKLDLTGFNRKNFDHVVKDFSGFIKNFGIEALCYIPVSAREGDNVVQHSTNIPWYDGMTILEALDSFVALKHSEDRPLRLPVQDIYKFSAYGDDRRIVAGTLSSGKICVGDELAIYPSGKRTRVKTLEAFNTPALNCVAEGRSIGFTMTEQIYIQRGNIVTRVGDTPPNVSTRLRASIFWLGKEPLKVGNSYSLKLGCTKERVKAEAINLVINTSDLSQQDGKDVIRAREVGDVTLRLAHPIAFDLADNFPMTGRFVLIDDYEICGGGIVLEALQDDATELRDEVYLRNEKWIKGTVTPEQRAETFNQRPALIIITGKKGMGRKRLAALLERQLFEDRKVVYYLGIGTVLYGVNADLKKAPLHDNWQENVRRFGEICELFLDAGMILIVTAVELTQADLSILKTVVDTEKITTIWLGKKVTTDLECDMRLDNGDHLEEDAIMIRASLQKQGIIYSP